MPLASGRSDCGPTEVSKCGVMGQTAGKPHHFSIHYLFKIQGLLGLCQQLEACLQTVIEHNPWFPDESNFDLKIWNQIRENVKQASRQGKNIPIDFWPLWTLIKAMIYLSKKMLDP